MAQFSLNPEIAGEVLVAFGKRVVAEGTDPDALNRAKTHLVAVAPLDLPYYYIGLLAAAGDLVKDAFLRGIEVGKVVGATDVLQTLTDAVQQSKEEGVEVG